MTGYAKRQANVGIAQADPPATATPQVWPVFERANIVGAPETSEVQSSIQPDITDIQEGGKSFTFQCSNIRPTCFDFGYLAWLFLGGDAFATGQHTITPADLGKYLNFKLDDGLDKGTAEPTEELVGGKIEAFRFQLPMRAHAALEISGKGTKLAAPSSALVPTQPVGAENAPLHWNQLRTARGGFVKIGYDGAVPTEDNQILDLSYAFNWPNAEAGIENDSDGQPTAILQGNRSFEVEVSREFYDKAGAEYAAWLAAHRIGLQIRLQVSTTPARFVEIETNELQPIGPYREEIGTQEDAIRSTLRARCMAGASPVARIITEDGTSGLYDSL